MHTDRPLTGSVRPQDKAALVDGWRALAAGVILNSLKDAAGEDAIAALDAILWLTSGDFPFWLEAVGAPAIGEQNAPDADGWAIILTGQARNFWRRYGRFRAVRGVDSRAGARTAKAHY